MWIEQQLLITYVSLIDTLSICYSRGIFPYLGSGMGDAFENDFLSPMFKFPILETIQKHTSIATDAYNDEKLFKHIETNVVIRKPLEPRQPDPYMTCVHNGVAMNPYKSQHTENESSYMIHPEKHANTYMSPYMKSMKSDDHDNDLVNLEKPLI